VAKLLFLRTGSGSGLNVNLLQVLGKRRIGYGRVPMGEIGYCRHPLPRFSAFRSAAAAFWAVISG
jgi:hypothetical protein